MHVLASLVSISAWPVIYSGVGGGPRWVNQKQSWGFCCNCLKKKLFNAGATKLASPSLGQLVGLLCSCVGRLRLKPCSTEQSQEMFVQNFHYFHVLSRTHIRQPQLYQWAPDKYVCKPLCSGERYDTEVNLMFLGSSQNTMQLMIWWVCSTSSAMVTSKHLGKPERTLRTLSLFPCSIQLREDSRTHSQSVSRFCWSLINSCHLHCYPHLSHHHFFLV